MKDTHFKVEQDSGDVISKDDFSQEQKTKLDDFAAEIM